MLITVFTKFPHWPPNLSTFDPVASSFLPPLRSILVVSIYIQLFEAIFLFSFIIIVIVSRVRLSPLGTAATNGLPI
jgi:hypothetical protein